VRTKRHSTDTIEIVEERSYGFGEGVARQVGCLPWLLRLDSTTKSDASFSIVPASDEEKIEIISS
jgi:hypothetical protein